MSSNESNDPLAELLGNYMSSGTRGSAGNLGDLLSALTQGGAAAGQAGGGQSGGMPQSGDLMGSLLGSLLGGGMQSSQGAPVAPQQEAGGLGDVMGALLGGGMQPSQGAPTAPQQGAGNLGDVMGALLGGGMQGSAPYTGAQAAAPQGGVGVGDILGAVLGGGGTSIGASPLLAPVSNLLSQKMGLPPVIAQAVVAFVLAKLMSGSIGGRPAGRMGLMDEGPGVQDLLQHTSSGRRLDTSTLAATGLPEELAQHTGMDVDTATQSLQHALELLGPAVGNLGAGQ